MCCLIFSAAVFSDLFLQLHTQDCLCVEINKTSFLFKLNFWLLLSQGRQLTWKRGIWIFMFQPFVRATCLPLFAQNRELKNCKRDFMSCFLGTCDLSTSCHMNFPILALFSSKSANRRPDLKFFLLPDQSINVSGLKPEQFWVRATVSFVFTYSPKPEWRTGVCMLIMQGACEASFPQFTGKYITQVKSRGCKAHLGTRRVAHMFYTLSPVSHKNFLLGCSFCLRKRSDEGLELFETNLSSSLANHQNTPKCRPLFHLFDSFFFCTTVFALIDPKVAL